MIPDGPVQVEHVRPVHRLRVPTGTTDQHHHHLALGDEPAAELDVGQCHPGGPLDGRVEAERLLHGGVDQGGVVGHALPQLGPPQQGVHRVADQVDSGLEAGDQQQGAQRHDVAGLDLLAGRGRQPADHVVPGLGSAHLDQIAEDPLQPPLRLEQLAGVAQ